MKTAKKQCLSDVLMEFDWVVMKWCIMLHNSPVEFMQFGCLVLVARSMGGARHLLFDLQSRFHCKLPHVTLLAVSMCMYMHWCPLVYNCI